MAEKYKIRTIELWQEADEAARHAENLLLQELKASVEQGAPPPSATLVEEVSRLRDWAILQMNIAVDSARAPFPL